MEHSQANIDALRSESEEEDSRMFVHVSHAYGIIFTRRSCYMEHSEADIDALRSAHKEADLRMFAHASHAMELYSPGAVVIWNIVKLTFMS